MAANSNAQTPVSIAYVTAPATSPKQRFKVRAAKITGGIQIACAVLSVIFGVSAILIATCVIGDVDTCQDIDIEFTFPAVIGWPVWGGVLLYGIAGILGVCSGSKNLCVVVTYMVMSIMSSLSACGQVIMEIIGAINGEYCGYLMWRDIEGCLALSGLQAMHSLGAVVAFVEMVVAIVGAAYCCYGVCWQPLTPAPQQVIVQYQPNAQGQVFQQPPPGTFQPDAQGLYPPPPTTPFQQGQTAKCPTG